MKSSKSDVGAREASQGERMIEVKVRFWTDEIAPEPGKIQPKHAWTGGVVRIKRNASHGIVPRRPMPFNSLSEISALIEKTLIEHGILLHPTSKMRKYVVTK